MLFLSKDDFYEVYLDSIISSNDRDNLAMLYQPIIGGDALSLYLSLYSDFKKTKKSQSLINHESLTLITGFNIQQIQDARRKLEAIGLIRTYYRDDGDVSYYKYVLYAPKTPKEFFDDVLFKGYLIEKIGEKNVQALMRKYIEKPINLDGFEEISDQFRNVFKPDFNSASYFNKDSLSGYDRKNVDITKGFDKNLLLKTLENNYGILSKKFKKKDIEVISQIALLYGLSEVTSADLISRSFNTENGTSIDFDLFKKLAIKEKDYSCLRNNSYDQNFAYDTSSKLGKKIEMMSKMAPIDYLKLKQKDTALSPSDILLINELNTKFLLNPGVINALLDYCLEKKHTLSFNYVTKIAASLVRENISSTLECMNYLRNFSKAKSNYSKPQTMEDNKVESPVKEEISDADLDELLSDL